MLKVYHNEDESLIEYFSHDEKDFESLSKNSKEVFEYSKFFNKHYNLVARLEEKVTRHGHTHPSNMMDEDMNFKKDLEQQIEGINMI
jgi:hypothetical protein